MINIGDRIDERYHITGKIAHGGMADVYEAYDVVSRKTVAIKIMREDMMKDPKNLVRFQRECIAAASLNNPNIVHVYGQGTVDGRPYMVNEYIKGQTLRDRLNFSAVHYLTPLEACEVMLQLTSGLQYIHDHGLVHRDIKPDNLFYLSDGSIKISDFGISAAIGEKNTGDAVSGTVYYTAPEILMGGSSQTSSDIYSMGIVFYEILVGKVPFEGKNPEDVAIKQIKNHFPEPSKTMPSIPKSLDKIVVKACRKRPEERFVSALDMHNAIADALKDEKTFKEKRGFFSRLFGFK
jgi:serine/threonine protein kinase